MTFSKWILTLLLLGTLGCSSSHSKSEIPNFPKGEWLQSAPLNQTYYQNHTTLVYFWDYTCLNCLRDLSYVRAWEERYRPFGFQVLLVHTPEFKFASRKEFVESALKRYGISLPVYLDADSKLWKAFKIYSWPTKVLIDAAGKIARTEVGEGRYRDFERTLRDQLSIKFSEKDLPEPFFQAEPYLYEEDACGAMTNETYIGYKRIGWMGGSLANREISNPDATRVFKDDGGRVSRGFFLNGLWTNEEDAFSHARKTVTAMDYLGLSYRAAEVYSVLSQDHASRDALVYVMRDGVPVPSELRGKDLQADSDGRTFVHLREARLYHLIAKEDDQPHEIKLWPLDRGVKIHTFSFGNRCLSQTDLFHPSK